MTFLNDLWKKFKSPVDVKSSDQLTSPIGSIPTDKSEKSQALNSTSELFKQTNEVVTAFQQNEIENLQRKKVIENLKALQKILENPKEERPEERYHIIENRLGEPEAYETVRQDRWQDKIHCPSCQSNNLKQITQTAPQSHHNHRYKCLDCGLEFNDDTGTPFESGIPNINVWMLCWYLMGCTDSLTYIAVKLNLDLPTVEKMATQLRNIFNAQKPLTHLKDFEEWNDQSQGLRKHLQEELLKQYEKLNANIATTPKDTNEFRRQQNLRRTLSTSTDPNTPTITPSAGKRR